MDNALMPYGFCRRRIGGNIGEGAFSMKKVRETALREKDAYLVGPDPRKDCRLIAISTASKPKGGAA